MSPAYDLGHSAEASYHPLEAKETASAPVAAPQRHAMGLRTSWLRMCRRYKLPALLLMLLLLVSCMAYRILSV